MVKCALVCGAGGFIGCHLVQRLKRNVVGDLRDQGFCRAIVDRRIDESISSLRTWAAAGSIFIGEHDAGLTHNSALVKLNVLDSCYKRRMKYFLFNRLPACIRPTTRQIRSTQNVRGGL